MLVVKCFIGRRTNLTLYLPLNARSWTRTRAHFQLLWHEKAPGSQCEGTGSSGNRDCWCFQRTSHKLRFKKNFWVLRNSTPTDRQTDQQTDRRLNLRHAEMNPTTNAALKQTIQYHCRKMLTYIRWHSEFVYAQKKENNKDFADKNNGVFENAQWIRILPVKTLRKLQSIPGRGGCSRTGQ